METIKDYIGNWPIETQQARENKKLLHIPPEKALTVIHGKEHKTKFTFFISNDRCHLGEFEICPGKYTDIEIHKGDEVLIVLEGELQVIILNELKDEHAVSRDAYHLKKGEKFLIPIGYKHQYFNLGSKMNKVLFAIAPDL